ncbi:MAG: DUF4266 domain-containing protein [Gammaproteobacteria bacterium]|nr:DUF4266 domain-containing protein [Gammaproteobacteria bacterium]
MRPVAVFALVMGLYAVCAGCSTVKPWERGMLAERKMQLTPSPVQSALEEHIYFSKEAAFGGQGVGGGGCGCT